MFRKTQKNYLELNVRVSYDESDDSVHITSKDKNLPKDSGGFHLTLSGGRGAEQTLREMLEDAGIITEEHILPTMVPYADVAGYPWNTFPLGKMGGSKISFWEPARSPNLLITGPAGAGKSVIERSLIFHCLQNPDKWRIYGIDPHRVELGSYKKHSPVVARIATELEDAVDLCRFIKDEMMDRYTMMEKAGVNNYQDLPETPHAILFLVDEVAVFLSLSGSKTEGGKAEDKLKGEASMLLTKIARAGRAAGIHLALVTQRPDVKIINQELRNNITTRIVMGRVDAIHSSMTLGNDEATRIPWRIRGRGYIQHNGQGRQFQAAVAPIDYDEWLKNNPYIRLAMDIENKYQNGYK